MARRDLVRWLTGHIGYAAYPRPDVVRPPNRLAEAENVWLGGTAGIATRRGGMGLVKSLTNNTISCSVASVQMGQDVYSMFAVLDWDGSLLTSRPGSAGAWNTWTWNYGAFNHTPALRQKVYFGGVTTPCVLDASAGAFPVPAAPTAANTGSGGYAATLRYYRVQWSYPSEYNLVGAVSPALPFTPSGGGTGVVVTRPALPTDNDPYLWRLWGSTDDETYYLLADTLAATETVTDDLAPASYPTTTTLSSTATPLRALGMLQASGLTVANTGSGTYAATLRYYRARWVERIAGVVVRRGEPSLEVSLTPSGTGAAARVTRPDNDPGDAGITHWELEASTDNANWYLLTTVRADTATYDDSAATSTYSGGTLSEAIGEFEAPPRTRAVGVDRDRVIFAGGITENLSRVWFTPVLGTTDVADEERVPPDNYFDLEAHDDDHITAVIGPIANAMLVFKRRSFFRLVRTGSVSAPYDVAKVSEGLGVEDMRDVCLGPGVGRTEAVYFVNGQGAWRYDPGVGLERLNNDLEPTWADETTPTTMRRVVHYPTRDCILFGEYAYHLATGGWSHLEWGGGYPQLQVVARLFSYIPTHALVMPSYNATADGLYEGDRDSTYWPNDVDDVPFVARIRTNRLSLVEPTLRWRPTRLRLWGTGGMLTAKTWVESGDEPATVAPFYLGTNAEEVDASRVFRPGPVEWLGLSIEDDGSADAAWALDAIEITGLPQESVP